MYKDNFSKKIRYTFLVLFLILFLGNFWIVNILDAKMDRVYPGTNVRLTLSNHPKIGEIAIIRLEVIIPFDKEDAVISCFLPPDLEFINDQNYPLNYERFGLFSKEASERWGNRVIFYSGYLKKEERKEFIFKIRIPDGKRYKIEADGVRGYDTLEIDLGDPEPPEWNPEHQKTAGTKEGREYIISGVKQVKTAGAVGRAEAVGVAGAVDLKIPKDTLPPLRTELKRRTKERPYLGERYREDGAIPFRYLVYVEQESPKVEVNCIFPPGWSIENQKDYPASQDQEGNTRVLLYSGPMRFKECKAFYFKVLPKVLKDGDYIVKAEAALILPTDERLTKTDTQYIHFGRVLE